MEHVDCPMIINLWERQDGSFEVSKAVTEHQGHEVSEERFKKYRLKRRLTSDQEDAAMLLLTQGADMKDIAKMLKEFTGIGYTNREAYQLMTRLKKARMRVNSETGEKMVKFQGKQISVEPEKKSRRREVP